MNDKKKCEIPEYVIDSMARALLPAILEFYSVEENRQAFEKWKAEQNDSLKQIEKKWKKDVSRIMPLTDENKEKNAENLKKTRKNDEKQSPGE